MEELLERISSRELTEWGLLFQIQAEEREDEEPIADYRAMGDGFTEDEDDEEDDGE